MLVPWGGAYETGREADAVSISALAVLMLGVFSLGCPMASRMYILEFPRIKKGLVFDSNLFEETQVSPTDRIFLTLE